MKLTIVIVNYNVKYYLEQCLRSVEKAVTDIDAEVYVVDNHSRDGSVEYIKERFPQVHLIASNHNQGFARANNLAIRKSQGEYVLLLNPDTFVGEQVLHSCIDFLDSHPQAGAAGVQMLKVDGTKALESRRGLPTPMTSFYKMTGLCSHFPTHRRFGHYYMGYLSWDQPAQIEVMSGAFCMVRRKVLDEVGLLDEDFFMYGEDIDLSYRILKSGYENWYLPYKILHYKGESTQKSSFRYIHVFYEAMLIFFKKHYGHLSFWLSIPIKLAVYMKAMLALANMLMGWAAKSMGFIRHNRKKEPIYVFIGRQENIDVCMDIANSKGLQCNSYVADHKSVPEGHLRFLKEANTQQTLNVVYDLDAYSYEQIMEIFAEHPISGVQMGTYNHASRVILTIEEVIV